MIMYPKFACFIIFVHSRGSFQGFLIVKYTDNVAILLTFIQKRPKLDFEPDHLFLCV